MITTNAAPHPSATTVTLGRGVAGSPKISADASVVVWNQVTEDSSEIMRYRDGKVDQITHNKLADMHATPSGDGSAIVFNRFSKEDLNDKSGRWQVVLWKQGQETLLTPEVSNCLNPTISTDGKVVAWVNDVDGSFARSKAQYYTVQDGQTHDLNSGEKDYAYPPALSSDGSRVFFRMDTRDGADIYMKDGDGHLTNVTKTPKEAEDTVTTTADGKAIFFSKTDSAKNDDLFRLDVETSRLSPVSDNPKANESWQANSADGNVVAWTNFGPMSQVQIFRKQGDQVEQISKNPWTLNSFPSVSADGKSIAYMAINRANTSDVAIRLWKS